MIILSNLKDPLDSQCFTSIYILQNASPKAISERTSYLRARLDFHRYPHLIPALFNVRGFDPPFPVTETSIWTWIGRPVSGLQYGTLALLRLAFASAPYLKYLTLHHIATRWPVLQKVRSHLQLLAPTVCKHMVSGSFSLPSRGSFHLSLTVLFSIGRLVVFSLGGWSPRLPTGFLVSCGTLDHSCLFLFSSTGLLLFFGLPFQAYSTKFFNAF